MQKSKLDLYLDILVKVFQGGTITAEEYWPLKPAQIVAYFDEILTVDVYKKVQILKEKNVSLKKVAPLFYNPLLIKNFLLNFVATGFKIADQVGTLKTSFREREEFFNYLFDILGEMINGDILIEESKQIILDDKELNKIPWEKFTELNYQDKMVIKRFQLALFSLVWALYFDTFYYTGFNLHGSYPVQSKILGENTSLVINEYFNLKPLDIWDIVKDLPFNSVRIYNIYKDIDWKINFFGRENPSINLGINLVASLVEIDGKIIDNLEDLKKLAEFIFKLTEDQTNFVNNLSDLKKVKKGAEIAYFGFRKLFEYFSEDWKSLEVVDMVIDKFGDEFIKKLSEAPVQKSPAEIRRFFDPRNNQI